MRQLRSLLVVAAVALLTVVLGAGPSSAGSPAAATVGVWVTGGSTAWSAANAGIGPLQSARIFYGAALPAKYAGSLGSDLPSGVTLVVSYNTPDTNVASYVCSIPATRKVVLVYYHEPENQHAPFVTGADFVANFTAQSAEIRQAAASCGVATVKVAMITMTWAYANSTRRGYTCSFIPPVATVDYYLADTYEKDEPTLAVDPGFQRWNVCTSGSVPQGLAEYGVGLGNATASGCQFTDAQRASVIQADAGYIASNFPNFALWAYSWVAANECWDSWQFPVGGQSAATWRSIAAGTPLPPVVSISQPASNATTRGTTIASGTADDHTGVARVQVSVDNGTPQAATGTSKWTATIDTTALADGPHTLTVQATDAAGTVGTASVGFGVDNSATVSSCPLPAAGTTELSGNLSLEGSQTGWTGVYNSNSAVTRVSPMGGSYDGSWALRVAPKASGVAGANNSNPLWVSGPPGQATTAGRAYTGSAFVRASSVGEKVTLVVRETSSSGTAMGSKSVTVTLGDTAWHQLSAAYTATTTGDVLHYALYASNLTGPGQDFLADCLSLRTS